MKMARLKSDKWKYVTLSEISLKFINGGTPLTSNPEFWNGEIPWIRSAWITKKYVDSGERKISYDGLKNSSSNIIPKNNVIIATRVSLGNVVINKVDVAINQDLTGIIIDKTKANEEFVYFSLVHDPTKITSLSQGSTIQGITRMQLENILIPLPPLEIQQKIVTILSNVDDLIYKYDLIIEIMNDLKNGIMQYLFHPKKGEKYIEKKLGIIVKFSSGEFLPEKNQELGKIPVFGGNGITGWHNKILVDYPTIVFGRVGAYCGSVHISKSPSWITDNAIFIKEISDEIQIGYLFRFLKRLNINIHAEVSAQPKISQGILKHILIRFPVEKNIQRDIVNILDNFDSKFSELESKKSSLEKLKKGLTQKLLTGEIRVI